MEIEFNPMTADACVLNLRPDDTLVVSFQQLLNEEQRASIRGVLEGMNLNTKKPILILDGGAKVEVLRSAA